MWCVCCEEMANGPPMVWARAHIALINMNTNIMFNCVVKLNGHCMANEYCKALRVLMGAGCSTVAVPNVHDIAFSTAFMVFCCFT